MAREIKSAKFILNDHKTASTKLTANKATIIEKVLNFVHQYTVIATARFKSHESLFVQAREKQVTRRKYFF